MSMREQFSKAVGATLFDEEVVAWDALEKYFLEKKLVQPYVAGSSTLPTRRMIRELLRMAAMQLANEIGPKIALRLAEPPPKFNSLWEQNYPRKPKPPGRNQPGKRGRKPAKKPDPMPQPRIYWNRRSGSRKGTAE